MTTNVPTDAMVAQNSIVICRTFREVGDCGPAPNVSLVDEQLRTDLKRIDDRLKTLQVRL